MRGLTGSRGAPAVPRPVGYAADTVPPSRACFACPRACAGGPLVLRHSATGVATVVGVVAFSPTNCTEALPFTRFVSLGSNAGEGGGAGGGGGVGWGGVGGGGWVGVGGGGLGGTRRCVQLLQVE